MNKKILSLFLLTAILTISFVLASVSALIFDVSTPESLSKAINSTSFTIKNNEAPALNITLIIPSTISDGSHTISITSTSPSIFQLASGATTTINITRGTVPSNFELGDYSSTIQLNAVDSENSSRTENRTVSLNFKNTYCDYGDIGDIEITTIKDETKDNVDEWEWHPLDNIAINVKVYNNLEDDIDAVVEYGLYDIDDKNFVDLGDETQDVSIDEGESEEPTIEFQVPADIDADHDYKLYVKAYEDGSEKKVCTDKEDDTYFQDITIKQETRDVVVSDIEVPETASCGDSISVNAKVYNIGKHDEDRVKVSAFNKELGVNFTNEIKNLDTGEESEISFTFSVPQNAAEKTHVIHFTTSYNYDDQDETYDKISETFDKELKVSGECAQVQPQPKDNAQITATLDSEANAGEQIIVKATIKNIGDSTASYILMTSGIESFATLEKIDPQSLTLDTGKSQDVLIYLKANNDAAGDYTFNIKAVSGTKIKEQPVSLTIQPKTSGLTGLSIFESLKANWFIAVVVLINIVLIILIIVVAVRIARK